jgi:hypothetical protein
MKNGIYWFSFLNEKEQTEFRENCEDFHLYVSIEYFSFSNFIAVAFDWIDTPQGTNYWREISKRKVQ